MKPKIKYLLIILFLIGIFLRFYNLNWGAPFYFHPDERNIATAVSQLNFLSEMNPHFFAYGSFPIYIIYFSGLIVNFFSSPNVSFEQAIIISRFYSAFFSILLIPALFLIGKKIESTNLGLTAAFLATFSTGLIQYAHFGTFEMWLSFFGAVLFWLCLTKKKTNTSLSLGITFGILMAIKISSIILLPIPLIALLFDKSTLTKKLKRFLLFCLSVFFVYASTNPFSYLDYKSFLSGITYESSVVLNTLPVFYTQSFHATPPIVFQFLHIFPFLINPLLTIAFIPAFFYVISKGIKTKNISYIILTTFYLIFFIPQALLFAKWTRYMVPTLPFVYLIIAVATINFSQRFKKVFSIKYLVFSIIFITNVVFGLSYFINTFVQPDTRIEASNFARANISPNSKIISEPYDLGLTTFTNADISIVNFYDEPEVDLKKADYIILPSQRILRSRILNPDKFPRGHDFYSGLIDGKIGYKKIYETPCDIFCKITYLNNPVFSFEETANVFDRPTVMIFKKNENIK